jgi:hypothetical protein
MTINSHRTSARVSVLGLSAFVGIAWLVTAALFPRSVEAAPGSSVKCTIITYYSDADKTKQVGTYSNCPTTPPKRGLTGKRTKYFDSDSVDLTDIRGPLHHPDPGGDSKKVPCDLLPEAERIKVGCGDLPGR